MFEKSFDLLKENGVALDEGLSLEEVQLIEDLYKIRFPQSLRLFLMHNVPISNGFYNWRDTRKENVEYVKRIINLPFEEIYSNADEVYRSDAWGTRPDEDACSFMVRERLKKAPRLIPICSHRYIPVVPEKNPPILSIHGVDVICYGTDLEEYIDIEFGNKEQRDIQLDKVPYIDFWSDIM